MKSWCVNQMSHSGAPSHFLLVFKVTLPMQTNYCRRDGICAVLGKGWLWVPAVSRSNIGTLSNVSQNEPQIMKDEEPGGFTTLVNTKSFVSAF